ncbi:IPT/TIG domain-containing protein [Cellulomonas triticagri]|nr:IPT/TIG domain-containing protein [Cellulomonas triticagri]
MTGAWARARRTIAAAVAAVLAFGVILFAPTAAQAAPGDASATSVAINLNAGVSIPPLVNIPLVSLTGTVGTAVAPAAGGTSQSGLLGVNLSNVLGAASATGQVTNTTATRSAAGSSATSEVAGVNVGLLGINAVSTGVVSAQATCTTGAQPTATANVAGLQVLGQAVTLNANAVNVPAINVDVAGLVGAQVGAVVRQVITTTSTTAASAAVVVDLNLSASALGIPVNVNLGSIQLAQASCTTPNATVTATTPTSGPTSGGTSVTITGNGLQNATGVTFGGTAATITAQPADGTSLTVTAPPSETAGAAAITVARPTGNVSAGTFTYVAPTITSVAPPQGTTAGGTSVTITGTGLSAATGVTFGGTAGTITGRTATTLTVTTPAHAAGPVAVAVVLPGLDVTAANAYTYVVPTNPTVATMTPTSGPAAGGTSVTITGTNLGNVSSVTFGGTAGTITAQSATSLTVTTPPHAPGPFPVVLTNPGGSTTAASPFTFTDDGSTATLGTPTPATVPTSGGTTVTVSGTGLANVTGVTVRGVPATNVVATGTSVTFTVPATETAGAAPVVLQFPAGRRTTTTGVTYVAPTLTAVTPASGPAAGGQTVTLTGTGLFPRTAVTFGGVPATVTGAAADGTSLTVTTPAHAPGPVGVVVTLPGADASLAAAYTYQADGTGVTVTGIAPATSPTRGAGTLTVSGSGFTGATSLRIGTQTVPATVGAGGTTVSATIPASETAGSVPVTIVFPAGETTAGALVYVAPTLTLDPTQGPTTGGTPVTITGTGLTGATGVSFGGTAGTGLVVDSDTQIRVTAPAHAAGPVDVVVTLPGLDATATAGYAYVTPGTATVSAVTPDSGPVAGGTSVTLTGTGLGTVTAVTFDGVPATIQPGGTATSLTVTTPPHAAGPVPITITNAGGTSTLPAGFTYLGDGTGVTVATLTPGTVPTAGGTTVTVTGTGFTGATGVTVRGAAASDVVVGAGGTSLTFTVPPSETAGAAPVVLQFPLGTAAAGNLTYQAPSLTSVAPPQGPTSGGTTVTLTGTGIEAATGVTFGGIPATALTVVGPGQITVTAPAQGAGAVPVQVTLPGLDPAAGTYTYLADGANATVTSVTPAQLPTSGGTITISGTNLGAATGVTVGGVPLTGVTVAAGTITGTVPPSETGGPRPVVVQFPAGTVPAGTVTLLAPTITALTPNWGVSSGGNSVTITGTNLGAATAVTFDGVAAPITASSPTSLTVTVPAGTHGPADVLVTLPGADAALAAGYTYLDDGSEAEVTGLTPTEVPTTGGTTVTITGTGLDAVTGVTIGGIPAANVVVGPGGTTVTATTPPSDVPGAATVTLTFEAGTVVAGTLIYVPPTITGVTPDDGPAAGGTSVTLTGTGFTGASQVLFDGVPGTITAVAPGGTGITVTTPAHAPGPVPVTVVLTGTDATLADGFTYLADGTGATVTGIAPTTVPTGGGTVTVSGTGLGPVTGVTVGGEPATVVDVAPDGTSVTVAVPATETAGPADVVLQFPGGELPAGAITYAAPTVATLDPASGVAAGGETVTLTGTGLAGATEVTFGGVPATIVEVDPDGLFITVTTPAGAPGPVDVAVTLPGLDAALADGFTYLDDGSGADVTGITPATTPTAGGGTITVTGTGLAGVTGLTVGGNAATGVVAAPDGLSVTAVIPPSETVGTAPVVLVFPEGTVPAGSLEYVGPTVTAVTPATGSAAGGTEVTITGTGLAGATGVLFGGVPGAGVTSTPDGTSVTVWTPAGTEGTTVPVTVQLPGLDVTEPAAYTYEADGTGATVDDMTPTTSPSTGGGTLTITGSGFTGADAVEIGGEPVPFDLVSDSEITLTIPPSETAGAQPVVIVYDGVGTVLAGTLTYVASTVTAVAPATGGVAGGTEVTLTGTGLGAVESVLVDGIPVAVDAASDTTLVFTTPAHAAGPVDVVLVQDGADVTLPGAFTYVPDGTDADVTGLAPTESPLAGGITATITGTDLGGATGVTVAGVPATDVVVSPDGTTISFTVPEGEALGDAPVLIQYPVGEVAAGTLTYVADGSSSDVTSLEPPTGVTSGGTVVTIVGTGFTGATGVTFGGVPGTGFAVVSDEEITVTTPAADAAGAVPVVIEFPEGELAAPDFTYEVATVTSILPDEGREAGGQPVTLTGTGLQNVTDVIIGGTTVAVTSASETTVTFTAPAHAPGVVDLVLVQPGADLTLPDAFEYLRDGTGAVVDGLAPEEVLLGGGATVTISGSGLQGATSVTVDGVAATDVVSAPDGLTITFTVPPGTAPGTAPVVIQYPAGPGVPAGDLTSVDDGTASTVDDLTPTTSPTAGGGTLTITGTNLEGVIGVTVGGVPATDLAVSAGTVTVTIPPGDTAGPADVVLQFPAGEVPAGTLTYEATTVDEVDPPEGPGAGGTTVTLTGENLGAVTEVLVDGVGVPATPGPGGLSLSFVTPPHAPGAVDLVLVQPGADVTLPGGFTYLVDGSDAVVDGIDPSTVPLAGGVPVVISGTGLTGATGVTVGGADVGPIEVAPDGTSISFTAPPGTAVGTVPVAIVYPGGTVPAGDLTYADDGSESDVTGIDPTTAPTSGGVTLTITGSGLTNATAVTVGGVTADDVVVVSDTEVTVTVPAADAAGAVPVVVVFPEGEVAAGDLTYVAATVDDVDPAQGPAAGGTSVTLTGENLGGVTEVLVDGVSVPAVATATTVTFTTPAHAPGAVDLVLVQPGVDVTLPGAFTYLADGTGAVVDGLTPDTVPLAGGPTVTIGGTGLTGATGVTVGGGDVGPIVVAPDGTSISFTAPPGTTPGAEPVVITYPAGPGVPAGDLTYADDGSQSEVTDLDPETSPTSGGITLTITGSGLTNATGVTVGGVDATDFLVVSDTEITVTVPAGAAGPAAVVVEFPEGELDAGSITYLADGADAVVDGLDPTTAPLAGGTTITIVGTDLTGASGVTVGGEDVGPIVVAPDGTSITFTAPPSTTTGPAAVVIQYPAGTTVPAGDLEFLDDGSQSEVTGIAPTSVGTAGGVVTITGSGFTNLQDVLVRGASAPAFTIVSDTEIEVTLPATETPGAAPIGLVFETGPAVPAGTVTYVASTVTAVSPDEVAQSGGQTVTVTGTRLGAVTAVLVDGVSVPATPNGAGTSLTFVAPAHAPGAVDLVLVQAGADVTVTDGLTYLADGSDAVVTGLIPDTAPLAGGTRVTITGTGLVGASGVTVDGVPATAVVVAPDGTSIAFTVPGADAPGAAAVAVQFPAGSDVPAGEIEYLDDGSDSAITSWSPATAPTSGDRPFTLTGTGFLTVLRVMVRDQPMTWFDVSDDGTTITGALPPSETGGPAAVWLEFPAGVRSVGTLAYAEPVVTTVSPAQGPVAGGTLVTLTGSGLEAATAVLFDGVSGTDLTVVPGGLTVRSPAGAAGLADVQVEIPGADAWSVGGFGYVPPGGPFLAGLIPASGPTAGGTTVTITGTGLDTTTAVTFGGVPATVVGTPTATQVVVVVPAHGAGPVPVAVTNGAGTSTLPNAYTYVAPATGPTMSVTYYTPRFGPTTGGQTLAIGGTGFVQGRTSVTFGGVPAQSVTVLSDTALVVVTPPHAEGIVPLVVAVDGVDAQSLGYEYDAVAAPVPGAPTVGGVDPSELPAAGGVPVTVVGTGFVPGDTSVFVCGVLIDPSAVTVAADGTSLTFTAPACGPGTTDLLVIAPGGTVGIPVTYFASGVLAAPDDPADGADGSGSGVLATTGSDIGRAAPRWALALVVGGAGLLVVRQVVVRHRRQVVAVTLRQG